MKGDVTYMNNVNCEDSLSQKFRGTHVSLIGAGVSNMPLVGFLTGLGALVTVRERREAEELGSAVQQIEDAGGKLVCGDRYLCDIDDDIIIRSPGIRPDIPELAAAGARGAEIFCEMELFIRNAPCPVFAVTGSDGKSTTTTILSKLLMPAGVAYLGGNIGEPLFHRVLGMSERDAAEVELSSFQLMTMDAPLEASVITNVTPNHLNWHTGMDEYIAAKRNILRRTRRAVLNYDNEITRRIGEDLCRTGDVPVIWFSLERIPNDAVKNAYCTVFLDGGIIVSSGADGKEVPLLTSSEILLPGRHNIANYMAAYGAAMGYTTPERLRCVAGSFTGVRHRLQLVAEAGGVRYYNSSIDSSPTRTAAAVSALIDTAPERRIVIICGGYDKKIPFEPLAESLLGCDAVREIVLTGDTRDKIRDSLENSPLMAARKEDIVIRIEPDFDIAIRIAAFDARPGESVLLSPACASFDAFRNFEERGNRFAALAAEICGVNR